MQCELCGKNTALFKAEIESVEMSVCQDCTKFGSILNKLQTFEAPKIKTAAISKRRSELNEEIVENYGRLIKRAREKLDFTQEELAKKLNEKESLITKLENNSILPSLELARKIEKQLNISLISISEEENIISKTADDSLTIEDLMKNGNKKTTGH